MHIGSEVLTLKATNSLFARLLIIARSARDTVNLQEVIGTHEFSSSNRTLMTVNGSVHPTQDKSKIRQLLEELPDKTEIEEGMSASPQARKTCLIVNGIGVVHELMAVTNPRTCKEFGESAKNHAQVRIIFDDYSKVSSLKESTPERRRGKCKHPTSYLVTDSTPIKDKKIFLSSNATKDSLTLFLAEKLIDRSVSNSHVTATRKAVLRNDGQPSMEPCSHEEADTLMIYHAMLASHEGYEIEIYSQDTDVLLLALRRAALLGKEAAIITGTGEHRHKVGLPALYQKLGPEKSMALINWHALTGSDTTGHISSAKAKKNA